MTKERGEYLARYVTNCVGCHTPRDPNTFVATGPDFTGGFEMEPMPIQGVERVVQNAEHHAGGQKRAREVP